LPLIHLAGAVNVRSASSLEKHKSCRTLRYIFTNEFAKSEKKNKTNKNKTKRKKEKNPISGKEQKETPIQTNS
jgi:hypothetical protein